MRFIKIYLFVILVLTQDFVQSQSITLNDLFSLMSKDDFIKVNGVMSMKGWDYYESSKEDEENLGSIIWTYGKTISYDGETTASAWYYRYYDEEKVVKSRFSFSNKKYYDVISNNINTLKLKVIDNSLKDNEIKTIYSSPNNIVLVSIKNSEYNTKTFYNITVIKKGSKFDEYNGKKRVNDENGKPIVIANLIDGKIQGEVIKYYTNGNIKSIANIINNKREGYCIDYNEDGTKDFEANYLHDIFNGTFKQFENNKVVLTGNYTNGVLNGKATTFYPDGNVESTYNLKSGKKDGVSYEFDENGELIGEYYYINGELNGEYKEYEEGRLYVVGHFINGVKNGKFKIYNSDGLLEKEYYKKDDLKNGEYIEYIYIENTLKLKQIGEYIDDMKVGTWRLFKIKNNANELLTYKSYSNGLKNGSFIDINLDTFIIGNYTNDKLNGLCKKYKTNDGLLAWQSYLRDAVLVEEGSYLEGLKNGHWKFYYSDSKISIEGDYLNDLKDGKWIDYDDNENPIAYYNFEKGKKNGKYLRTAFIDNVIVPCSEYSSLDTCYREIWRNTTLSCFYKNDILEGQYQVIDSNDVIIAEGSYLNGKKNGNWVMRKQIGGFEQLYVLEKGAFINGERSGYWEHYLNDKFLLFIWSFKKDMLDGKCTDFRNGIKFRERQFSEGELEMLSVFDTTGTFIIKSYEIYNASMSAFKCRMTKFEYNGEEFSQEYTIILNINEEINIADFEEMFDKKKKEGIGKFYLDGKYESIDSNGNVSIEGSYFKGQKIGTWKYYFHDLGIYYVKFYYDNAREMEFYYKLNTNKFYSGKFKQKYKNGKNKSSFNISHGLRNGKSKYYNEKGRIIKIENYKKGILQK